MLPMPQLPVRIQNDAIRWRAVLERDSRADGSFVYAVKSTGVYCRPSCASRRPRRDRVEFFEGGSDALRAGYRACRRCRPDDPPPADPWIDREIGRASGRERLDSATD